MSIPAMDPPELRIQQPSPTEPQPGIKEKDPNDSHEKNTQVQTTDKTSPATRRTLHQNILGKLRPLPLQYHWTFWYDKHADNATTTITTTTTSDTKEVEIYNSRLSILYESVSDIATFYRIYNNYPWEKIPQRDTVHIFRKGVKPIWEDPENLRGGCWRFRVPKRKAQAFFHEIAILAISNEFQAVLEKEHDHVLGVSTSVRFNTHLISVWNKLGSNEKSVELLKETILNRLSPELRPIDSGSNSFFYKRHDANEGFKDAVESVSGKKE
ncbi:eukaryotic translation initiation factor 4E [Aspergillus stella-maris]|uniref:eukaryotic translation initiation factor 4E n=1 Tax=Aspergillus stella-maris TaxID=1810926 RepID=UPI003CCE51CD